MDKPAHQFDRYLSCDRFVSFQSLDYPVVADLFTAFLVREPVVTVMSIWVGFAWLVM